MGDFYSVLGVPRSASAAEVRHAFRTLAPLRHPDTAPGPGAARRFAELRAAYETLADPAARRAYDESLPSAELAVRAARAPERPRPPRAEPPPRQPAARWRVACALEAYRAAPRTPPLAVDVLAW